VRALARRRGRQAAPTALPRGLRRAHRPTAPRVRIWPRRQPMIHTHARTPLELDPVKRETGTRRDRLSRFRRISDRWPRGAPASGGQRCDRAAARQATNVSMSQLELKLGSGLGADPRDAAGGLPRRHRADGAPCTTRPDAFAEMRSRPLTRMPRLGPEVMPAAGCSSSRHAAARARWGSSRRSGPSEAGKCANPVVSTLAAPHAQPEEADLVPGLFTARSYRRPPWIVDGRIVVRMCVKTADVDEVRRTPRPD